MNVEWEVRVSDTSSAWLKAEKTDGTTVTVSVTDNGTPEQRTGSFTVVPTNNEDVKAKSVTVVQTGSDVEYKFAVEPAALTFEAEGAAAQTVTITAEGGLTWEDVYKRQALQSLTPSMMDAWLSESEMMASWSVKSGSNTPPFASKHAA